jgi:hypothetical protein
MLGFMTTVHHKGMSLRVIQLSSDLPLPPVWLDTIMEVSNVYILEVDGSVPSRRTKNRQLDMALALELPRPFVEAFKPSIFLFLGAPSLS